uniref:EamA domain-containing protein n=1 Tax=viral metagenome TaxID=1070528 RepID=A0A6C0JYX0_9ZZZZ
MYTEVLSKILSESLLSLYPVFVKNIDLPLHLQLWSRFITYIVITGFFVDWGFIAKSLFSKNGLLLSFVTIIHVYTSYRGFQLLESGIAYSLFYTYPLMILLFAGEPINGLMFLAIIGVILLSNDFTFSSLFLNKENGGETLSPSPSSPKSTMKEGISGEPEIQQRDTLNNSSMFPYEGYVMIAIAAATEAIIYFIVRAIQTTNNWNHLFLSYFAGTFLFSFIGIQDIAKITLTSTLSISLFINAIIGLCGYLLRFYAATRLSPSIYAPLSYIGIVMAYVYGFAFNGERVTIQKTIGTLCILAAIFNRKL